LTGLDPAALFIALLVLVFSLSVHEAAHAWTADRLGDSTGRKLGRLSLNPAVHIDLFGTILLPLLAFVSNLPIIGWAKPVPVSLRGLSHPRRDMLLIAAAGPASNLVLAALASVALRFLRGGADPVGGLDVAGPLWVVAVQAFQLNLLLAVFNMIPIPPLDGGNVLGNLLPPRLAYKFDSLRPYGVFILYGLMLTGILRLILDPPMMLLARLFIL
jgi:Zn-dependent protease